jgi:hypothetical protein
MQAAAEGIEDPLARVGRRGAAYIEFGLANPEHYRLLMMSRPDCTPERFLDERLISASAFDHTVEDVAAAIAAGLLRYPDPVLVASGLWMMVHGVTSLLVAKPDFPWPDHQALIEHVLAVYGSGLAVDGTGLAGHGHGPGPADGDPGPPAG